MEIALVHPQNLGFPTWSVLGNSSHRKSVDVDVSTAEEAGVLGRGRVKGVRLLAQHAHRYRWRGL